MTVGVAPDAVVVSTHGPVSDFDVSYAREKVGSVLRFCREPVLHVRVTLTHKPDPAIAQHAVVEANLDLNGRLVRAHVARPSMQEAVDEVRDRLRDQVQRLSDQPSVRVGRPPHGTGTTP
jgi:ribosome-associated translation inhibitor RaiA